MNDPVIVTALIGAVGSIVAFFAGIRKRKSDAAKTDAEAAMILVAGFKDLMDRLHDENKRLAETAAVVDSDRRKRILALVSDCDAWEQRCAKLEHELLKRGIPMPNGGGNGKH